MPFGPRPALLGGRRCPASPAGNSWALGIHRRPPPRSKPRRAEPRGLGARGRMLKMLGLVAGVWPSRALLLVVFAAADARWASVPFVRSALPSGSPGGLYRGLSCLKSPPSPGRSRVRPPYTDQHLAAALPVGARAHHLQLSSSRCSWRWARTCTRFGTLASAPRSCARPERRSWRASVHHDPARVSDAGASASRRQLPRTSRSSPRPASPRAMKFSSVEVFVGYWYGTPMKDMMGPGPWRSGTSCSSARWPASSCSRTPWASSPASPRPRRTGTSPCIVRLVVFVMFNYYGLKENGLLHYLSHLYSRYIGLPGHPLNSVASRHRGRLDLIRPLISLSIRLMLNMAVDHLLVVLILGMVALLLPIPVLVLEHARRHRSGHGLLPADVDLHPAGHRARREGCPRSQGAGPGEAHAPAAAH